MEINSPASQRAGWPSALTLSNDQSLEFDGVDLVDLAKNYGTPLWALSRSTIESNFTEINDSFRKYYENVEIAYSVKANNTFAVIRLLQSLGALMDCSAEYEFDLALEAGVLASNCIINGNGKSDRALENVVRRRVRQVNVDSLSEAIRIRGIAENLKSRIKCTVRVQLGYKRLLHLDPSFGSMLTVGEGKFGCSIETGEALKAIETIVSSKYLDFIGLHHHVGFSGYMGEYEKEHELMHHRECAKELASFATEIHNHTSATVHTLNIGGGYRAGKFVLLSTPGDGTDGALYEVPTADEYAKAVTDSLKIGLQIDPLPLLQLELGSYPTADAGIMLTKVTEVKDSIKMAKRYVVADAGMWTFISRGLMRVGYPVLLAKNPFAPINSEWPVDICGQVCVFDAVAEGIYLPDIETGNILVYLHQGGYTETQSTQFNSFPRPATVLLDQGKVIEIRRRETLTDITARNLLPEESPVR